MPIHELYRRAKAFLSSRKPMNQNRRKQPAARKGPAGESRKYRVTEKSPIGKAQSRSRKTQAMLDELD